MSLDKSIVIINEYTVNDSSGGSNGKTPGDYITQYVTRDNVVATVSPVKMEDSDDFDFKFGVRKKAVSDALIVTDEYKTSKDIKDDMHVFQGKGGIAFGNDDYSLSDKKLRRLSKTVQNCFEKGKTILKTVVSFTDDYLKKMNVLPEDFEHRVMGDYKDHIDQLKLRMGIASGIEKLASHFDNLRYIGAIHLNTDNVHCHLTMYDAGKGKIMGDGFQKGCLTDKAMFDFRLGIDRYFEMHQYDKFLRHDRMREKNNVRCFVKNYQVEALRSREVSQDLLSCLPDDKSLWHFSSDDVRMKKANAIMSDYIENLLNDKETGYGNSIGRLDKYVDGYMKKRRIPKSKKEFFMDAGKKVITEKCADALYRDLAAKDDESFVPMTQIMDDMSMPYDEMMNQPKDNFLTSLIYKLRSYKSRLGFHSRERDKFREAAISYEEQQSRDDVDPASIALYDYFKAEAEYNDKAVAKYQHLLSYDKDDRFYRKDIDKLKAFGTKVESFANMLSDNAFKNLSPSDADAYGMTFYGIPDGRLVMRKPRIMTSRFDAMKSEYSSMRDRVETKLASRGYVLNDDNTVSMRRDYAFDDIRMTDAHHLEYDFEKDIKLTSKDIRSFGEISTLRNVSFERAKAYLDGTGQSDKLSNFPVDDIRSQSQMYDSLKLSGILRSKIGSIFRRRSPKSSKDVLRNVDIAEDLKAMNEGITDIAGHGASRGDKKMFDIRSGKGGRQVDHIDIVKDVLNSVEYNF